MANKIKYGLKNVYYAIATIDTSNNTATYADPVAIPGAVNLSMDAQGEPTPFYADNIEYFVTAANTSYEGDLEIALVPESFEIGVLGMVKDGKNILMDDANATPVHFALLFQFEGDDKATRHILYNCVVSTRPSVAGATKEDSITPQTETLSLRATAIHNATLNKDIMKAKTSATADNTTYEGWFSAVYTGTAPTP